MGTKYQQYRSENQSYKLFDSIASSYNFLNHILSFGLDLYWRKKFLAKISDRKEIDALDVACGTGDLSLLLLQDLKITSVIGIDLSGKMIELARKKLEQKKYQQAINFEVADGQKIPYDKQSFGLVTIAFGIRNFSNVEQSLREIHRVLRPGGRILIMEFSLPANYFIRKFYLFYLRHVLPLVGGIVSRNMSAYKYLNSTVESFPYGDDFANLLKNAQFNDVTYQKLTFGIVTLYKGDKC